MPDTIGAVGISVNPETRGFKEKVETAVRAALRGIKTDIPAPDADFSGVQAQAVKAGESVQGAFKAASKDSDQALNNVGGRATFEPARLSAEHAGEAMSRSFKESARESDRALKKVGDGNPFSSLIKQAFALAIALSSVQALLSIGKFAALIPAALGAASALISLAGALAPLIGLLGVLPGAILLAGAAFGVFALATKGVGEALKAHSEQAKNSAATARANAAAQDAAASALVSAQDRVISASERVTASEKGLERAQRSAREAQLNLTNARKQAREELENMRLAVIGARLSEERARISLQQAQKAEAQIRNQAAQSGVVDALALADAALSVQEAELNLQQAIESRGDTTEKANDMAQKGVEGSDLVVAAQQAIADAQDNVATATDGVAKANQDLTRALEEASKAATKLADVGVGATDKFKEAMAGLSPAAQSLVNTLISFEQPMKNLSAVAAQGLFPGVEAGLIAIRPLFETLSPVISITAGVMGNFVQRLGELIASPAFSGDLVTIGTANAGVLKTLGDAFLRLVPAFTDIGVAAIPLVQGLAELAKTWAENTAGAVHLARETGSLQAFFEQTLVVTKQVLEIFGHLGSVLKNVFGAAAPEGKVFLDLLVRGAAALDAFVQKLRDNGDLAAIFEVLRKVVGTLFDNFKEWLPIISGLFNALKPSIEPILLILQNLIVPLFANKKTFEALIPIIASLQPLFEALGPFIGALSKGFNDILLALLPIIPVLSGGLTRIIGILVTTVLPPLVAFLVQMAPLFNEIAKIVADVLVKAFEALAPVMAPLLAAILQVFQNLMPIVPALAEAFLAIVNALIPLIPTFAQILLVMAQPEVVQAFVTVLELLADIINKIAPILPALYIGFMALRGAFLAFQAVSFIIGLIQGIGTAFEALGLIISLNPIGAVVIGIIALGAAVYLAYKNFEPFRNAVDAVGRALRDAFFAVVDWVKDMLPKLEAGFKAVSKALGPLIDHFQDAFGIFKKVGALIVDLVTNPVETLKELPSRLGSILWDVIQLFINLPIRIGEALFNLAGLVIELLGDVPGQILDFFVSLPGKAVDALIEFGPGILEAIGGALLSLLELVGRTLEDVIGFFVRLPLRIIEAVINLPFQLGYLTGQVGEFIIGKLVEWGPKVLDFFFKLPGRIFDALVDLAPKILRVLGSALDQARDLAGRLIGNIFQFFADLPSNIINLVPKMLDAGSRLIGGLIDGIQSLLGRVGDIGKSVANAIIGFINRSVIDNINQGLEFDLGAGPFTYHVNPPNLPHIPQFASGSIVNKRTVAIIGEAGKEVVLPLTNAKRTLELAQQSGLFDVLAKATAGQQQPASVPSAIGARNAPAGVVFGPGSVVVEFSGSVTPEEARMVGQSVGRGIQDVMASQEAQVEAGAY